LTEPTAQPPTALLELPADRPLITAAQVAEKALTQHSERHISISGAAPASVGLVARALIEASAHTIVVLCAETSVAHALHEDLGFVVGQRAELVLIEGPEASPYADVVVDRQAAHRRLAALFRLANRRQTVPNRPDKPLVVVLSAGALIRKVVPAAGIVERSRQVVVGKEIDREQLIDQLTDAGYLRVPLVEDPGTLAVRGALLDVWTPAMDAPARIELDGEHVSAIRTFDPSSQRTGDHLEMVWLLPARETAAGGNDEAGAKAILRERCDAVDWPSSKTRNLIEDIAHGRAFFGADAFVPAFCTLAPLHQQLPVDTRLVVYRPSVVASALHQALEDGLNDAQARLDQPHFPFDAFFTSYQAIDTWLRSRPVLALSEATLISERDTVLGDLAAKCVDAPSLAVFDQSALRRTLAESRKLEGSAASLTPLVEHVNAWHQAGLKVIICAASNVQAERIATMLRHRDLRLELRLDAVDGAELLAARKRQDGDTQLWVVVGSLSHSAVALAEGLVLLVEEDLFGSRSRRRRRGGKSSKKQVQRYLEDLRALTSGEHVVHVEHGIGRYEGLLHRNIGGHTVDLLVVAYAGGDKLYLPVYRLNQIQKLHGTDAKPKLDRLGGQTFARSKSRTKKKVRQLADELLRLYAARSAALGEPTPAIDEEYRSFEATFPFEETDDQIRAIEQVGEDLESPRPMDRLVCGDVGFGKTEVALRAAFRVAMSGRQVAVLCPTTVLAQQHKLSFDTRLSGYPLVVASLSRFSTKKQQLETTRGLRDGTIDVVIGTHRLLSKDVQFKRLGLLVIDEEQRFGVAAKERVKNLKTNVDVLVLSATPIPRTLQMAISGIRDLTLITTAPLDRRAVRTIATRFDPATLREAIGRELGRGGQIFYVHNRIVGLEERAAMLQQLAPQARLCMAHGQMREQTLERTMLDFVSGRYDILCSTAIIENGLDIPRCNTIIIDRAELFGLAQLYQLRGRVGRAKERGYCYLVVDKGKLNAEARGRIEALQRYSELGSGFQIASLDLDLRGAGDLLGAEQSGSIASVGFEMFCQMLDDAVRELQGQEVIHEVDPELSLSDVEALLPDSYVPDVGVRLSLYKRLASAADQEEVFAIAEEMEDRFGAPPVAAGRLVELMALKPGLRRLRVLSCEASARSVTLHLRDDAPLDPIKLTELLRSSAERYRLTPDMRLSRHNGDNPARDGIEATAKMLSEIDACVRVVQDQGGAEATPTSATSSSPS